MDKSGDKKVKIQHITKNKCGGKNNMAQRKKTMYTSMNSLAVFLCKTKETDFETAWKIWEQEYNPPEEFKPELRALGSQLIKVGPEAIKAVPELRYRKIICFTQKPTIHKEEKDGNNYCGEAGT